MEDVLTKFDDNYRALGTAGKGLRQDFHVAHEKIITLLTWRIGIRGVVENYLLYSTVASLFLGEMMFHKVIDVFRGYPIVIINTIILLALNRLVIHRNHAIFIGAVMFLSLVASRHSGTPVFSIVAQILGISIFSVYYISMLTYGLSLPRWVKLYCQAALVIAAWGIVDLAGRMLHIFPQTVQTRLHSIFPEPSFFVYLTLPAIGIYLNAHLRNGGYRKELALFLVTYALADLSLGFIGLLLVAYCAYKPRLNIWKMMGFFVLAVGAFVALFFASANFQLRVIDTVLGIVLLNLQHVNASTYAVLSNLYVTIMTFISHPFIGVGIGGYQFAYGKFANDSVLLNDDPESFGFNMYDASSLFLRTAAELGLFGLISLFGFLVVCARVKGDQHVDLRNALVPFFILRMGRYGAYFSLDLYFFVGLYLLNYMHYRAQVKARSLAETVNASKKRPGKKAAAKIRLVDDPDESWREFGRSDPYFGVLSEDKFRAQNLNEAVLSEFFESGEDHVARTLDIIRNHVTPNLATGDALDFGCGVGRLVLPLATRFGGVVGVDISEAYIAEAVRNRDGKGLTNIQFAENLDQVAAQGRRFDLVHSYIVFNHVPWSRGKDLIARLFMLLREDGVMAVHVLHRRRAKTMRRLVSWGRKNFLPLHWLINIGRGRSAREPLMQGNEYPLDELLPFLGTLGARHFHVRIEPALDGDSMAFIFCRKAGSPELPKNP